MGKIKVKETSYEVLVVVNEKGLCNKLDKLSGVHMEGLISSVAKSNYT